jgi:hypothetical protein
VKPGEALSRMAELERELAEKNEALVEYLGKTLRLEEERDEALDDLVRIMRERNTVTDMLRECTNELVPNWPAIERARAHLAGQTAAPEDL